MSIDLKNASEEYYRMLEQSLSRCDEMMDEKYGWTGKTVTREIDGAIVSTVSNRKFSPSKLQSIRTSAMRKKQKTIELMLKSLTRRDIDPLPGVWTRDPQQLQSELERLEQEITNIKLQA